MKNPKTHGASRLRGCAHASGFARGGVLRCSDSSLPKSYACGAHKIVSFKFSLLSSIKVLVHTMGNAARLYHNTSHLCSPSLPRMNSTCQVSARHRSAQYGGEGFDLVSHNMLDALCKHTHYQC